MGRRVRQRRIRACREDAQGGGGCACDGRIQSAYGVLCKTMYAICAYQRSHLTPCLPTRPESCLGREPPEMATVKRAFFSMASFCAFMTKTARASISSEVLAKEKRIGSEGGPLGIVVSDGQRATGSDGVDEEEERTTMSKSDEERG